MALLSSTRLRQSIPAPTPAGRPRKREARVKTWCSAVAVDAAPPSSTGVSGIRWGASKLQGLRSEMEDDIVVRSGDLEDFSFAAVFDGHAGFSSVEFLKYELYNECALALQGGLLLSSNNFSAIRDAICQAFESVDKKLLVRLENMEKEDESGSTATVMFLQNDVLIASHVGDSCVVISRCGKAETLTRSHRPYGNNEVSLEEGKRVRRAGGWIMDGRICGVIAVSRAFGDIYFKSKKNELLKRGVAERRWTEKFISRVQFNGDLVVATPDTYKADLGPDVEFIILASDGLWDYIKSSDAVTIVRDELRRHGDAQLACEALAGAALDQRSEDNISIVVADLGKTDWQNLPVQGPNFIYELSQAFATIAIVSIGIWITSLLPV